MTDGSLEMEQIVSTSSGIILSYRNTRMEYGRWKILANKYYFGFRVPQLDAL
jgi:hypothetical protein